MFSRHAQLLRLLMLCLFVSLFASLLFSSRALAANNSITINSQTDTLDFPKSIDFKLSAHDDHASIIGATIFIKYNTGSFQDQHRVVPSPTSPTVAMTWHDDLTQNYFTPNGTAVSYYWIVEDSNGLTTTSNTQNFTVNDTRFDWQHLTQGYFQVNWYNRPTDFGQTILTQVGTTIKRISTTLGIDLTQPINIWVYQNSDDFHNALPPDTYEWTGGIAFPALNQTSIVVENTGSDHLSRDMPHELTHLIFHQKLNASLIPLWFDEGLAVYNQNYHEPEMALRFKSAVQKNQLLHLDAIFKDFSSDSDQAYLAYAESWNLLDYMYSSFGPNKMQALMQALHNPSKRATFDKDLETTLGSTVKQMESDWHQHLGLPSTLSPAQTKTQELPTSHKLPDISTSDINAPAYVFLGILLIVLPTIGYSGLFVQQRRLRRQALLFQQADLIMQSALTGNPAGAAQLPYTPLSSNSSAQIYAPPGHPYATGAYPPYLSGMGGPFKAQQTPQE